MTTPELWVLRFHGQMTAICRADVNSISRTHALLVQDDEYPGATMSEDALYNHIANGRELPRGYTLTREAFGADTARMDWLSDANNVNRIGRSSGGLGLPYRFSFDDRHGTYHFGSLRAAIDAAMQPTTPRADDGD